jgi:hypothetical protein
MTKRQMLNAVHIVHIIMLAAAIGGMVCLRHYYPYPAWAIVVPGIAVIGRWIAAVAIRQAMWADEL